LINSSGRSFSISRQGKAEESQLVWREGEEEEYQKEFFLNSK
jgi:hypothetical protein